MRSGHVSSRPVRRAAAALGALLGVLLTPSGAGAEEVTGAVLTDGQVQLFAVEVVGDEPVLTVRADLDPHLPEQVRIEVDGDASAVRIGADVPERFRAVATPGAQVHQLTGAVAPGLPSLGWWSASPDSPVSVDVTVSGPGRVVAFTDPGEGQDLQVEIDSARSEPSVLWPSTDDPTWPTWLFDSPGEYVVRARPTLHLADGGRVDGRPTTTTVTVTPVAVPVAPSPPIPPAQPAPTEHLPAPDLPAPDLPAPSVSSPSPTAPSAPASSAVAPTCTFPGLAAGAQSVTDGHFDFGVQVRNGSLLSRIKDDRTSPPVWRDPASLLFELGDTAEQRVPASDDFGFLGAAGSPVWSIGQTQVDGVPWLGWNTQHESAVSGIRGATTWTLDSVTGPGDFFVYQTGSFGAVTRQLGTAAGWPRVLRIPANTHGHGNLTFTAPGDYRIATTHSATLVNGTRVTSSGTLHVRVGDCVDEPGTNPPDGPATPDPQVEVPGSPSGAPSGGQSDDVDTSDEPSGNGPAEVAPDAPVGGVPGAVRTPSAPCVPAPAAPSAPTAPAAPGGDAEAPPSAADVSTGHFDFGARVEGGALLARVKDDRTQPPTWVDPDGLRFVLGATAEQQVPDNAAYGFLGTAGDRIWMMPQTQVDGVPWLGWNTQHESLRAEVRGPVRFRLDSVEGPGKLAVYLTDSFGGVGEKMVGNVAGFPASFDVPVNVHAHGNWAFTAPGDYTVTVTQSATLSSGEDVSDTASLRFRVGGDAAPRNLSSQIAARITDPGLPAALTAPGVPPTVAAATPTATPAPAMKATGPRDCVLPDTGLDSTSMLLAPLGLVLVLVGTLLVAPWRRTRTRSRHA